MKQGQRLFVIDPKPLAGAGRRGAKPRSSARRRRRRRPTAKSARLKPLAERKAIGQKEADDAASNAELAAAAVRSAEAKLREVELNLGYTNVIAPITGLSSRAPKSEGSLVNAERHAADDDLAGASDLGAVRDSRERAARAAEGSRRRPPDAAEGQRVRRHDQADRRHGVPAPGPHQLRRHARQSVDRLGRIPRRDSRTPTAR